MAYLRWVAAPMGGALCIVAVAALAAAIGHVVVDALGDVLLPHDTYDDLAHDARTVGVAVAVFLLLAAAARSIFAGVRAAAGSGVAREAFGMNSPARFVAAVVTLAVPFVLMMEAIDAAVAGRAVNDLGDLFGGSILLGFATTAGVALAIAFAAVKLLRFFCTTRGLIVRAVVGFFQTRLRAAGHRFSGIARRRELLLAPAVDIRRAAERGPPSS